MARALTALFTVVTALALGARTGPAQSGTVAVPGGELYYESKGVGRTVVLLHGGLLDCRMWDGQFDLLAERYRVVRYDARGHGRSSRIAGDFSRYRDLHALLTALDIPKATLVGLSAGGRTAIDFAIVHPEMVEALLLVSPGLSGWAFDDPLLAARQVQINKAAETGDLDGLTEWFLRSWTDGPKRQPADVDPTVRERVRAMARANVGTNGRGRVEEVGAASRLGEIHVPTLVVLGELDMADIHGIVDLIAAKVPGARRLVVPGVAHMVNMEKPAEFNRILLYFLQASAW